MYLSFLRRRYLHVVAKEVREVDVDIAGGGESAAFELDGREGPDGRLQVAVAAAVENGVVARTLRSGRRTEDVGQTPKDFVENEFAAEPEKLSCGVERVVVGFGKYGAGTSYVLRDATDEGSGDVGVGDVGEDVDVEALFVGGREIIAGFDEERLEVADFWKRLFRRLVAGHLHEEVRREFRRRDFQETFEVGSRHGDIDIVVPRNETAVAYGAEQCASVEPVRNGVAATNVVDGNEDVEHLELSTAQVL